MKKFVRLTMAAAAAVLLLTLGACGKSCDHGFGDQVVKKEPTCQEDGLAVQTCEKCGEEKEIVLAALSHDYESQVTKEPSCGEEGVLTKTCKRCGDSKTESIPAAGEHSYEETVTKAPTCVETGEKTRTCTVCGHTETEELPLGDHTYSSEWKVTKKPTCAVEGEKTCTCAVCGETKTEAVPKTEDHSLEMLEHHGPSCTEPGYVLYKCTVCGETQREGLPAMGHYGSPATCTQDQVCELCGEVMEYAPGHTTSSGVCGRCGKYVCAAADGCSCTCPDLPVDVHYFLSGTVAHSSITIESVIGTFEEDNGYMELKIEICGRKLNGKSFVGSMLLYDENGQCVDTQSFYIDGASGAYFKTSRWFTYLYPGEYTVQFVGYEG